MTNLRRNRPAGGSTDLQSLISVKGLIKPQLGWPAQASPAGVGARFVTNHDYGIHCIAGVRRPRYFHSRRGEVWRSWVSVGKPAFGPSRPQFNRTFQAGPPGSRPFSLPRILAPDQPTSARLGSAVSAFQDLADFGTNTKSYISKDSRKARGGNPRRAN